MIALLLYLVGVLVSSYLFYVSGVLKVDIYDLYTLLTIYIHLNNLLMIAFILIYSLSLSLFYFIRKNEKDATVYLSLIFSLVPFFLFAYYRFGVFWAFIFIISSILLSFLFFIGNKNEESIYKIIPFDKLSYNLVKSTFFYAALLFSVIVAFNLYYGNNAHYIDDLIFKIGGVKLTDINTIKQQMINNQEQMAVNIANASIYDLMNHVYMDPNIDIQDKIKCLKSINNNRDKTLKDIKNGISLEGSSLSQIDAQLNKINVIKTVGIKVYPIVVGIYLYMLFGFLGFLVFLLSWILIKIYKMVSPK